MKKRTVEKIGLALVVTAIVGMFILLSGCATTQPGKVADAGVHADHATTAYGILAMGATELNPIAPLAPIRYWGVHKAEGMRCEDGQGFFRAAAASGWSGGAWNLLMLTAGPVPAVVAGVMGAVAGYHSVDCEAVPATEAQIALLNRWERAYESGDMETLSALMDNPELLTAYESMIHRTVTRSVEYTEAEKVRGGFIVRYRARWVYPGGTDKVSEGDIRFVLDDGRIKKIG